MEQTATLAGSIETIVAPVEIRQGGEADRMGAWALAFESWKTRIAPSTARSYEQAWEDILAYAGKLPWQIGRADVANWVAEMAERGLAETTRNLRVAAISSFYHYTCTEYTILVGGREVPLHDFNPASGKSLRAKINPYGKAVHLSVAEARALLRAVDRSTAAGLRDFSLLLTYLFTGRRNTEARSLRRGDIELEGERAWYRWSGKGKVGERYELPRPAWDAICAWLRASGRDPEAMDAGEYIFTPLSDRALRLPNVSAETYDRNHPLSAHEVGRILKKWARRAGLDPKKTRVHGLRHTAAHLRKLAGDDMEAIRLFLAQASLDTTRIYLNKTEGHEDQSWAQVGSLLGI